MTELEFAKCMAVLYLGVGRPLSKEAAVVWYDLLKDLPVLSLQKAVARWLSEVNSGFPSIAALRKMAIESEHGELLSAGDAFALLRQAISKTSPFYEPQKFLESLPPLVRRAVEMTGGVGRVADLEVSDVGTYAAQFRGNYESACSREDRDRRLPQELRPRPAIESQPSNPSVLRIAEAFGKETA